MPIAARALLLALALFAAGCTLTLDINADQCQRDQDCARFGGACNLKSKLCMKATVKAVAMGRGDGGADGATDAADGGDAAVAPAAGMPWTCGRPNKPVVRIENDFTSDDRLICDNDYVLTRTIYVKPGVTLTIDAGTTIMGAVSAGTLVVQPGGRLIASALRMAPIVFTSAAPVAQRKPGDWGGLILLGRASTSALTPSIDGLAEGKFGGNEDGDTSGVLRFVRIEYTGVKLGNNDEGSQNGLTLAGVGRGTIINHVQVRQTTQDCFRFIGGMVNAKHLICQRAGDDGIELSGGFRGKLQFLAVQQDPAPAGDSNGIEIDNHELGAARAPLTETTLFHLTMCGKNQSINKDNYGVVVRRGARAQILDAILLGFQAGIDVRDAGSLVNLRNSVFGNPIAYVENNANDSIARDDDVGFDELKHFSEPERKNEARAPGIGDCFHPSRPSFAPATAIKANAQAAPDDGFFDPFALYVGAFKDTEDGWARGPWVVWQEK